jgi:hypothetical protein
MSEEEIQLTPEQAQAEMLMELRHVHRLLDTIRGWIAFFGTLIILAIVLAACHAWIGIP